MYKSKKPYHYGTGRRKSSVARVHLFPNGTGAISLWFVTSGKIMLLAYFYT